MAHFSGSEGKRDLIKELAVLDKYFRKVGNASVQLVVFRNELEKPEKFAIADGDWGALRKRLQNVDYDGDTQLGVLDLEKYACDEFILMTDGISTFGNAEIKLSGTPVYVINSQTTAQHSYLNYVAQKTGGTYINLTKLTTDEGVALLANQPFRYLGAEYEKGTVEETYPGSPALVQKEFSLAGILLKEEATITLKFGIGNRVMSREIIHLKKEPASDTGLLTRRIWAQKKMAELDMQYDKNKLAIIELGKEYSIVTRDTSLIVLDSIADYVRNPQSPP